MFFIGIQQSCLTPGENCQTCTHPDFQFSCRSNHKTVCLHHSLVCDNHAQCDGAEDEDIKNKTCYNKLLARGDIKNEATLMCYSKQYPSE